MNHGKNFRFSGMGTSVIFGLVMVLTGGACLCECLEFRLWPDHIYDRVKHCFCIVDYCFIDWSLK